MDNGIGKQFGKEALHYVHARKGYPEAMFEMLKSWLSLKASILDLGCGTGIGTFALWEHGYHLITGCDADPLMLYRTALSFAHLGERESSRG